MKEASGREGSKTLSARKLANLEKVSNRMTVTLAADTNNDLRKRNATAPKRSAVA